MAESSDPQRLLREFQKCNEFFVGIDSDGCAFDTMEVKHKECFIPNIIRYYNLAAVSKYAREAAEFINLYSQWRGINRFPALIMSFDLLIERPEVLRRHHPIPALTGLRRWVERETKLSNPTLKAEVRGHGQCRPGASTRMERGGQSHDRRGRPSRAAVLLRPGVSRKHARQGRRDGCLGHTR